MTPEKTLKVIQTILMILTSICCVTSVFAKSMSDSIKLMALGIACYGLAWVAHLYMKGVRR